MTQVAPPVARPAARAGGRFVARRALAHLWLAPTAIALLALTIYPTIYMVVISFHKWSIVPTIPREFIGLENYLIILRDSAFYNSLRVTLIFVVVAVVVELTLGFMLASVLALPNRVFRTLRALYLIPTIITPVVSGLIWRFMLSADVGIINYFLGLAGIPRIPWLGVPDLALLSVILVDIWQWTPFMTLVLLAGLESLPVEPFEAARVDGASRLQLLRYVTLPMLAPVITVALLFRTFDAFKAFDVIYTVTRGGPGEATQVLSYDIWMKGFFQNQLGYAAALSVIVIILLTLVAQIYIRLLPSQLGKRAR